MAWVTWRQHRSQFVAGLGLLVGLAAAALDTHLPIHAAYHRDAVAGCLPPSARAGCDLIVRHFESEFGGWAAAARGLVKSITELAGDGEYKFMEVCGGHTLAIYRHGLEQLLPPSIAVTWA